MIKASEYRITSFSENAILIQWPEIISVELHQKILTIAQQLETLSPWILEQVCSYSSVIVYYRFDLISAEDFIIKVDQCILQALSNKLQPSASPLGKNITIEVLYNHDTGWDLANICQQKSCSSQDVIAWHSHRTYRAYALGFIPGFCYLASVDNQLQLPRKTQPRKQVPAGAVAIAEQQTAVYPESSPGGWHIIGQTPQAMYQLKDNQFTPLIHVGDLVTFKPISEADFLAKGGKIQLEGR